MTEVGMKIKHLRELKNYTQEYMARELGMSITGYGKIERDETEITLLKLEKIAKVLNTNFRKILDFDERKIYNIERADNAAIGNDAVYYNDKMIEHLQGEVQYLRDENARLVKVIEGKNGEQ
jgi:transcriptional regulator with XRE-family HTH domain